MSSEASGREGLLTNPGPAPLLAALSSCLSEALGLSQRAPNTSTNMPAMTSGCFAVQTSAATAKILENLTASPRFLVSHWNTASVTCVFMSLLCRAQSYERSQVLAVVELSRALSWLSLNLSLSRPKV